MRSRPERGSTGRPERVRWRPLVRALLVAVVVVALHGCGEAAGPPDPGSGGNGAGPFLTTARPAYAAVQNHWGDAVQVAGTEVFTTDGDHILKDGQPFIIRGVVYVPGYPGYLPWEIEALPSLPERLRNSIDRDMAQIAALGANTIRFWGVPRYCYESLERAGNLFFLQTLWIDAGAGDLHDPQFKEQTKAYFRSVIDRIHSVFRGGAPPLIAYLVGNELSEATIRATNAAHPALTSFSGAYISSSQDLNASEVFLAEMADYVKQYEHDTYGMTHLVSYSNDIRTADLIDTPFLDFRSANTYSYSVPQYRPGTAPGSASGTLLQGWIEELVSRFPDRPLLVTETGLSVSPNATRVGPPDFGYGGNTEADQATGLLQNLTDIETSRAPVAGAVIHEFLDAWWKFGLDDSYSQDPNDVEEWFGIVRLVGN